MAERRMFAKSIIDSDAFLTMPISSQLLYFHLCMRADDDGFVNNPRSIQKMIGSNDDDYGILIKKRFIFPFENGVVVIKHWRIHNLIQSDRYIETKYLEEKSMLGIKENKAYTLVEENENCTPLLIGEGVQTQPETECIHDVSTPLPQVRLGKDSIGKNKKENKKRKSKADLTIEDIPKSYISILDSYQIDGELKEAFMYFILMRLKANSKFTEHALDLTIRNARKMYPNDERMQIECVNQSVEHGWLTIYEVKNSYKSNTQTVTNSTFATPLEYHYEEDE